MQVTSEGLESIRGQGYIGDTGPPGLMKDVQVKQIVSVLKGFVAYLRRYMKSQNLYLCRREPKNFFLRSIFYGSALLEH